MSKKGTELSECFKAFDITYVPIEQNSRDDLLSKLASTKISSYNRNVIQETIDALSIIKMKSILLNLHKPPVG